MKYISPVIAGILCCADPLVAYIANFLLLQHRFGIFETVGSALIIFSVCIIIINQGRKSQKSVQNSSSNLKSRNAVVSSK